MCGVCVGVWNVRVSIKEGALKSKCLLCTNAVLGFKDPNDIWVKSANSTSVLNVYQGIVGTTFQEGC